jgi:kynurenine formamidase
MNSWIDISQRLDEEVTVWPGDTPFFLPGNWSKEDSGAVNVGQITMSIHTGTHIDAPFHFDKERITSNIHLNTIKTWRPAGFSAGLLLCMGKAGHTTDFSI